MTTDADDLPPPLPTDPPPSSVSNGSERGLSARPRTAQRAKRPRRGGRKVLIRQSIDCTQSINVQCYHTGRVQCDNTCIVLRYRTIGTAGYSSTFRSEGNPVSVCAGRESFRGSRTGARACNRGRHRCMVHARHALAQFLYRALAHVWE